MDVQYNNQNLIYTTTGKHPQTIHFVDNGNNKNNDISKCDSQNDRYQKCLARSKRTPVLCLMDCIALVVFTVLSSYQTNRQKETSEEIKGFLSMYELELKGSGLSDQNHYQGD